MNIHAAQMLRVGLPGVHTSYDPSKIWVTDQWFVLQNLGLTLLSKNKANGFVGRALQSWKITEDGKLLRIKLRKHLKFSNGDNINSESVSFSLKRLILKSSLGYQLKQTIKNGNKLKSVNDTIDGIKIISDHELEVAFNAKFINLLYFLSRIEFSILNPKQVDRKTLDVIDWSISSGPYTAKLYKDKIILNKNPFYTLDGKNSYSKIEIIPLTQTTGFNALIKGKIDILNFGAVFDKKFEQLQDHQDIRTIDFEQMSSCYFQFNPKNLGTFDVKTRRALFIKIRSKEWKPYPSKLFFDSDQMLTFTMPLRLGKNNLKEIENNWDLIQQHKQKIIRVFYPEFFGTEYLKKIEQNFKKLGIPVRIHVVPIQNFLSVFNSNKWDILFTMMEMTPGDIRTLLTQLYEPGGMSLPDPNKKGVNYIKNIFSEVNEFNKETETLIHEIHSKAFLIPLFQTRWPYYVRKHIKFDSIEPYELDFKLWKISR